MKKCELSNSNYLKGRGFTEPVWGFREPVWLCRSEENPLRNNDENKLGNRVIKLHYILATILKNKITIKLNRTREGFRKLLVFINISLILY
jgi:hypothetical protein